MARSPNPRFELGVLGSTVARKEKKEKETISLHELENCQLFSGRARKSLPRVELPLSIDSRIQDGPDASVNHAVAGDLAHVRRQTTQRPLGVYDQVSILPELSACGV